MTLPIPDNVVAFDTETHRIGPQNLAPKLVCLSIASSDEYLALLSTSEKDALDTHIDALFNVADEVKVGHNAAFDLTVLAAYSPDLLPGIFKQLENGMIHDTKIREKLLNLATHGRLDTVEMPDGSTRKIRYSLSALVMDYLGEDLSAGKEGEDAWRTNYDQLDGVPVADWPEEARKYAQDDAVWTLAVWFEQESRRREIYQQKGIDPFETQDFRVAVDFALRLMSIHGMAVDPEEKAKVEAMLAEELAPEKLALLVEHDILIPGKPAEPYKNGAKAHVESCEGKGKDCDCPPKMKRLFRDFRGSLAWRRIFRPLASPAVGRGSRGGEKCSRTVGPRRPSRVYLAQTSVFRLVALAQTAGAARRKTRSIPAVRPTTHPRKSPKSR